MTASGNGPLERLAETWANWMVGQCWQAAVVFVLILFLDWLLKKHSARLRYCLWMLVLVRLVLPPDLALPTGWGWWLLPPVRSIHAESKFSALPGFEDLSSNSQTPHLQNGKGLAAAEIPWKVLLMLLWGGALAAQLGVFGSTMLHVWAWTRKSVPIFDANTLDIFESARTNVGLKAFVELRNSEACSTPVCIGILRPTILVPSQVLRELAPEELYSVFVHELWHIRRRDPVVNFVQAALGMVYFFHPIVWWANRMIRCVREEVCDELTVTSLGKHARSYAAALVRVSTIVGYQAPPSTLGILDGSDDLKGRLLRILKLEATSPLTFSTSPIWVVLFVGLLVLPCSPRPGTALQMTMTFRVQYGENSQRVAQPPIAVERWREPADRVDAGMIEMYIERLRANPFDRNAVQTLLDAGPQAETSLLSSLWELEIDARLKVYEILGAKGTNESLRELERRFVDVHQREQYWIREAIERIRNRSDGPSEQGGRFREQLPVTNFRK